MQHSWFVVSDQSVLNQLVAEDCVLINGAPNSDK